MWTVILATVTLSLIDAAAVYTADTDAAFDRFVEKYRRSYKSPAERAVRRAAFSRNVRRAEELAERNPLANLGVTRFSDFTDAELAALIPKRVRRNARAAHRLTVTTNAMPAAVDWRTTPGVVGPIKDQGQCGSCWAFSAVANIESQWALAGHPHVALSEQQLVSCDTNDSGCNGGDTFTAWQWLIYNHNGTITTEASYPYVSGGGKQPSCTNDKVFGARIEGYVALPLNESQLAAWAAINGPPSICLNADVLLHYNGGIITDCPKHNTDHCVLIVGYNTTNSPPYWIVRNSWGTGWGERGYFRLAMYGDLCGMLDEPGSSQIKRPPPAQNITYYSCDQGCYSCQSTSMEDGVCSDGGIGWSMIATCDNGTVTMTQFEGPHCTGVTLLNATLSEKQCYTIEYYTMKFACNTP